MALTLAEKVRGLFEQSFSLSDIPGFPEETYSNQLSLYNEAENWFKGDALNTPPSTSGQASDLYPLKVNPLVSTVLKHAYILFGEVEENGKPLVYPKLIPRKNSNAEIERAREAEEVLNYLWWENNGRALMLENGILSQIYGGCVFKATYVPWEKWRRIPIRIERIHPKSFIGRANSGDMYRLREGWIVSNLPLDEARKWGYTGFAKNPTFVEYWSQDQHRAWVNKDEAVFPIPIPDQNGEYKKNPVYEDNPFGFVPVVYIPHIRAGAFRGMNAIDQLKGIVKEINLRFADYGDAVNDDSHTRIGMKNVNGSPQVRKIADGLEVIDLGSSGNITGGEHDPDLFEVGGGKASPAMKDLLNELIDQYRRDSYVPAVAEGEDEGSQRSSLTLATRFWPLTSHAGMERIFFGAGLDVFNNYLLQMMAEKGLEGINENHTKMRMKQSWAPMLPRDREAEVQEWQVRATSDIASVEHLIEMARDVDDVKSERENIIKWLEEKAQIQAEANAKAAQKFPAPTPFSGNSINASGKSAGRPKTQPDKTPTQKRGGGGE
ncbi:phage portal protein [Vibrio sp.]|uniref:phage portal protein n=1 Tax=Vibrio sp. TaxID=678 RepID=UPI003D09A932